ncbi:hypothetical protein [Enterobacter bugandensis]|uniref:hypothetical protein n=1 Tax=Enterobacter bugandensis TaxID=881260 RepID=UPI003B853B55
MKYAFIRENAVNWPVRVQARLLGIHPSGYYAWLKQPDIAPAPGEHRLYVQVRQLWLDSGKEYGYRRIYEDLRDSGEKCTLGRVRVVLKSIKSNVQSGGYKTTRPANKPQTLDAAHPPLPNLRWVVRTSALTTQEGIINLTILVDLFSGRIIRWALYDGDARESQLQIVPSFLLGKQVLQKLVVHFDNGANYTHQEWRRALRLTDPKRRIRRRGPYQEQRHTGCFFQWLLAEKINDVVFATNRELQLKLFDFIEEFNSRQRPDSLLNPLQYCIPDILYGGITL